MELVIATSNRGKYEEFAQLLDIDSIRLLPLADFPRLPAPAEQGATFAENARQKAGHYHRLLGLPVVADDSGLQVDLLDGAPGLFSARYAGAASDGKTNIEKLLRVLRQAVDKQKAEGRRLKGEGGMLPAHGTSLELPQVPGYLLLSPARFVCALSLFFDGQEQFSSRGTCEGFITSQPKGDHGFGYDPVFFVLPEGKTMAELTALTKNRISHRGAAARQLRRFLVEVASQSPK